MSCSMQVMNSAVIDTTGRLASFFSRRRRRRRRGGGVGGGGRERKRNVGRNCWKTENCHWRVTRVNLRFLLLWMGPWHPFDVFDTYWIVTSLIHGELGETEACLTNFTIHPLPPSPSPSQIEFEALVEVVIVFIELALRQWFNLGLWLALMG